MSYNSERPRSIPFLLVCAFALSLQACGSSSAFQLGKTPAKIVSLSGDYQSATPGQTLPLPLKIKVVDGDGLAVPDAPVQWRVVSGDAIVRPDSDVTDIGGKATATVSVGSRAGPSDIEARVATDTNIVCLFTALSQGQDTTGALPSTALQVKVGDNYFDPTTLRIRIGQMVTWVWVGDTVHYVTFRDTTVGVHHFPGDPADYGVYGNKGKTWSYTFTKAGTFTYFDNLFGTEGNVVVAQ